MDTNLRCHNSRHSFDGALVFRNITGMSWHPRSFTNVANDIFRANNPVLDTVPVPVPSRVNKSTEDPPESPVQNTTSSPPATPSNEKPKTPNLKRDKSIRYTIVTIVIVEAKGLPASPEDGASHGVYCKFSLGTQTYKSKSVPATRRPQWREQFKLQLSKDQLLTIDLWNKGKQKNFMGSCVLDLSFRERERTHDIWQDLDGGYGSVHLSVTLCTIRESEEVTSPEHNVEDLQFKYAFYNLSPGLEVVGELHVKIVGARGLYGRPNAYCILELDNEKVQTPTVSTSAEPVWNKTYVFNIYDVSSTLELKMRDNSISNLLANDFLGKVTIPLLRIKNGESYWYALKDTNLRKGARGNCPRVKLEINTFWNPVTASLKLFRPKQVKYTAKPPKFNLALVYKNVKFIRDTFEVLYLINESFKRFLEWEDREYCTSVLLAWLCFWNYFNIWMGPLLIIAIFPIAFFLDASKRAEVYTRTQNVEDLLDQGSVHDLQNGETVKEKIKGLPEMTLTITAGIEYLVSVAERLYNLASFQVPFLSVVTIILLLFSSIVLYNVPFRYLMMAFGLYKYGRKRLNPHRVLNNDFLDFISRIPDNKLLMEWKELSVPEPQVTRTVLINAINNALSSSTRSGSSSPSSPNSPGSPNSSSSSNSSCSPSIPNSPLITGTSNTTSTLELKILSGDNGK